MGDEELGTVLKGSLLRSECDFICPKEGEDLIMEDSQSEGCGGMEVKRL